MKGGAGPKDLPCPRLTLRVAHKFLLLVAVLVPVVTGWPGLGSTGWMS